MNRPNILCFVVDQLRYDHLGCTGNEVVETPNIDALAAKGTIFERSYVVNPTCMPARASLFTGRTPRGHGVRANGIPLSTDIPTLPEALSDAGYVTQGIGKLHLNNQDMPAGSSPEDLDPEEHPECRYLWGEGPYPFGPGIEKVTSIPTPYYGLQDVKLVDGHAGGVYGDYLQWLEREHPGMKDRLKPEGALEPPSGAPQCYKMSIPQELHYNRWIADAAIEFLEEAADADDPFFLWCSFPDPHHPYAVPQPWCDLYDPDDIPLPRARREGELDDLPWFYRKIHEEPLRLSGIKQPAARSDRDLQETIALTYGMIGFVDQEIGRVMETLEASGMADDTIVVFMTDHGDMMGDHWMMRKGPFHFEGLLRIPTIWSWPGHIVEGAMTRGLASQIDFVPTVLDYCDLSMEDPGAVYEPAMPEGYGPLPGISLRTQLEGTSDSVNEWVIVENDEDYLGLKVRSLITDRYKLTIYAGQPYGELFDLLEDPDELRNLWSDPASQDLVKDLKCRLLDAYVLQESVLPRKVSHS